MENILEKVKVIEEEVRTYNIENAQQLEGFRLGFLKKSIPALMGEMKNILPENRKDFGIAVNQLKKLAEEKFKNLQNQLKTSSQNKKTQGVDLTLPTIANELGTIHPLRIMQNRILEIFEHIGFNISEGPEVEDDWHNFTALNFPPNHPAREMQDTFFVEKKPDIALRTHTSSVQIRVMENEKPPIRTISPGRVYRNEAISARSHCFFHQIEGLYIDTNVSFVDLKQTLYYFAREMFGKDIKVRFRPSFFPFTEPSAEMDIYLGTDTPATKRLTKGTGWLEILGCGMVDPNVLENSNISSEDFTGFAFGMGLERMTLFKYSIDDLRLFSENDVRFLRQFTSIF